MKKVLLSHMRVQAVRFYKLMRKEKLAADPAGRRKGRNWRRTKAVNLL